MIGGESSLWRIVSLTNQSRALSCGCPCSLWGRRDVLVWRKWTSGATQSNTLWTSCGTSCGISSEISTEDWVSMRDASLTTTDKHVLSPIWNIILSSTGSKHVELALCPPWTHAKNSVPVCVTSPLRHGNFLSQNVFHSPAEAFWSLPGDDAWTLVTSNSSLARLVSLRADTPSALILSPHA